MKKLLATLTLIVIATITSVACTAVEPGYVGIKVSNVGTDKGVQSAVATTGWTTYFPLTTAVYVFPTYAQTYQWTLSAHEGAPANEEITFTNADQMQIAVDVSITYHLEAAKVPEFYVKFRNDDLKAFTYGPLHNWARDAFNEEGGKYNISQIMGDNAAFLRDVRATLQKNVTPIGVQIDQFGIIGAPRPPQSVINAINDKIKAVQLAQQKQNELAQTEADMAKERTKNETYSQNKIRYAEAEAEANLKVAKSLTPELVEWKKLDKWDGKLPQVSGSNGGVLLNLTK